MDVGAQLRQARESLGLSIEVLSARTRIPTRVLEALERNDLSLVPPNPYARGFIAAYAREVRLQPDVTVRNYFAQFAEPLAESREGEQIPASGNEGRGARVGLLAAGAAVVLAIAFFAVRGGEEIAPPASGAVGTTGTTPGGLPAGEEAVQPRAGVARDETEASGATLAVTLEATGPAWVSATVDGHRQLYQLLEPGDRRTLHGTERISIRVGDAGAVTWSVDGGAPVPMGRAGEVRSVTLTPESRGAPR